MQSGLREYEILRGIESRIAELKSEFRLFHQETIHYRTAILARLDKLEEKAERPAIDWQSLTHNLWFKLALVAALATGNTQLLDLVAAAFQK